MPTGYTAELYDGEQSFESYLLRCARAFGATVEMRDLPLDTPLPESFEPSDYHLRNAEAARDALAAAQRLTLDEAQAAAEVEHGLAHREWARTVAKAQERADRYRAMREQVEAWEPPSEEHQGLKAFMIDQINVDGSEVLDMTWYPEPQPKTGADYKAAKIERAERDIEYHERHYAEERERADQRTQWVQALRRSLGVAA